MQPHAPQGDRSLAPDPGGPHSGPPAEAAPAAAPETPKRPWAWVIASALVAGLVAIAAGETTGDVFTLTDAELQSGDASRMARDGDLFLLGKRRVTTRAAALNYGIFGLALGATLGLAGGLSRRSPRGAILGALAGGVTGGALVALTSLALVPVYLTNYNPARPNLLLPLVVHGGIWASVGLAGGLGLAVGRGTGLAGVGRAALGGVVGAALGTVIYEVVYAVAFPLSLTEQPVPAELTARALALLIVALAIGLGAAYAEGPRRQAEDQPAA